MIGGLTRFLHGEGRELAPVIDDLLLATDAGFFAAGAFAFGEGASPGLEGWQEAIDRGLLTDFANLLPEPVTQGEMVVGVFPEFFGG